MNMNNSIRAESLASLYLQPIEAPEALSSHVVRETPYGLCLGLGSLVAAPEGIEPPSKVPETFVLSIKLRSRVILKSGGKSNGPRSFVNTIFRLVITFATFFINPIQPSEEAPSNAINTLQRSANGPRSGHYRHFCFW